MSLLKVMLRGKGSTLFPVEEFPGNGLVVDPTLRVMSTLFLAPDVLVHLVQNKIPNSTRLQKSNATQTWVVNIGLGRYADCL